MDILMLLVADRRHSVGYDGLGDFVMDPVGRLRRRGEREVAPFVYAGVVIVKPELFDGHAGRAVLAQPAVRPRRSEAGRLYGLRLDGQWLHVGTPAGDRRWPKSGSRRASAEAHGRRPRLHDPAGRAIPADLADALLGGRIVPGWPDRGDPLLALRRHDLAADPPRRAGARALLARACRRGARGLLPRIVPLGDVDEAEESREALRAGAALSRTASATRRSCRPRCDATGGIVLAG